MEKQVQIKAKAQVGALIFNKAPIKVLVKYSDYSNIFSVKIAAKLPKYSKIDNHAIELKKIEQLPFGFIYSPKLVELKTMKMYIKTNPANGFI